MGRSLGRGMREFKDSISGITETHDDDDDEDRPAITAASTASSTTSPEKQTT